MYLRRRTTHALAGTGALLIVVGLSLGGGVAVAVPGPTAQPPADVAKATTTSSDTKSSDGKSSGNKSSDKKSSKGRKSRNDTSGTDSTGGNGGSTDAGSNGSADSTGSNRSTDSTAPTPTTTTPTTTASTTPPSTTATTRPTATTAPPPTTEGTGPAMTEPTSDEANGQYNGGPPYQATEAPTDDSTTTTTLGPGRATKAPVSRSGSSQPPGADLFDPGNKPANSSPAPAAQSAPSTPAVPLPAPVATAESPPSQRAANPATASGSGSSEPGTATEPSGGVSGTNAERSDAGAARHGRELVVTGDATRRLIIFGGVAMLLGAVVVAFTGRERQMLVTASLPVGPARRPRPRKEIDGWEDGVPLAPTKRELARHRLGISVDSYYGDELEV